MSATKNLLGWGNSGAAYGYKPYAQVAYMTSRNAVATKQVARVARRQAAFETAVAANLATSMATRSAEAAATDLVDTAARTSSTVDEANDQLNRALNRIRPGAAASVQAVATDYARTGLVATPREGIERAIAEELVRLPPPSRCNPLSSDDNLGATSVAEWFADRTSNWGSAGRAIGNALVDWHCSPASTAVGSMITSIWTGPAGGAAAGAAATQLQQAAGCDFWALSARLARQTGMSRGAAFDALKNGEYLQDPATGAFVKSTSLQGLWIRYRNLAPYVVGGLIVLGLLRRG